MRLRTVVDRYPAKMVEKLAFELVERYAVNNGGRLLDPFSGSGAVLAAANELGIAATGIDINPIAAIYSNVKLFSYSAKKAMELLKKWIDMARNEKEVVEIDWPQKSYWFTFGVINKYERLRKTSLQMQLFSSNEGRALLLCYILSVRLCSKADQRSPKPFISRIARESRKGKHYDPYKVMWFILEKLNALYSDHTTRMSHQMIISDIVRNQEISNEIGLHSCVITSPPYINAQDYFRNFKLELYLLEGMIPLDLNNIKFNTIGTERGDLVQQIPSEKIERTYLMVPGLKTMEET